MGIGLAKTLIGHFGFVSHDAPGEAEAECALLEQQGIVDAVLSEDVDTIMFGCTRTLRNWSSESTTVKTPTHVTLYDVKAMNLAKLGLDREGMVLVALMSGGDYLPEGIPGCGVKVACQAARAGYGSICRLKTSDKIGLQKWRDSLIHELQTNESAFFKTKHKALTIPEDFPNIEVLRYYTHPVVSPLAKLEALREKFARKSLPAVHHLREFTRHTFDWDYRGGAIKFIRVMSHGMFVKRLQEDADPEQLTYRISGQRMHFSTDATTELRISHNPLELVPIDLSQEVDEVIAIDRGGLALNSDDDYETPAPDSSQPLTTSAKIFDVTKPLPVWVLEEVLKQSIPASLPAWRQTQEAKAARSSPKKVTKKKVGSGGAQPGPMDRFFKTTKGPHGRAAGLDASKEAENKKQSQDLSYHRQRLIQPPPPLVEDPSKTPLMSPVSALPGPETSIIRSRSGPRTPTKKHKCLPTSTAETIIISSSPMEARQPADSIFEEEEDTAMRQIISANLSTPVKHKTAKRGATSKVWIAKSSSQTTVTNLKQASIEGFTQRWIQSRSGEVGASITAAASDRFNSSLFSIAATVKATVDVSSVFDQNNKAEELGEDDLPPLSAFTSPISESSATATARSKRATRASPSLVSPAKPSAVRKKVYVARTSELGYFKEVEIEEDWGSSGSATRTTTRRKAVARRSEVEVVDLTQA